MGYQRVGLLVMLLRQKPKDKRKFIAISDDDLNYTLQIEGFIPMYYWNKIFYYIKSEMLNKFLKERR
jgi:hypothetical protein